MPRPTILLLIGTFLPGFKSGGPVPSIINLVARLSDEFEFLISTSDRDLGAVIPYPNMPADCWIDAYGAKVRYCTPPKLAGRALAATLRETPHDLLCLNSFSPPGSRLRLYWLAVWVSCLRRQPF